MREEKTQRREKTDGKEGKKNKQKYEKVGRREAKREGERKLNEAVKSRNERLNGKKEN